MRLHEEMLHLLPNLQHLVMGFVGPDFPITGKDSQRAIGVKCCPECKSAGRTRKCSSRVHCIMSPAQIIHLLPITVPTYL